MNSENLESKINRIAYDEMAKILLEVAAKPEVRDHIAAAVENAQVCSMI